MHFINDCVSTFADLGPSQACRPACAHPPRKMQLDPIAVNVSLQALWVQLILW